MAIQFDSNNLKASSIVAAQRSVVLDIEGTTSPISFVTDVLFPYARDNVRNHLDSTYGNGETSDDIALLRAQVPLLLISLLDTCLLKNWLRSRASL